MPPSAEATGSSEPVTVRAIKVRRGLYRLDGVTCTSARCQPGLPPCGGQVYAEWFEGEWDGDDKLPPSWECYCEKCLDCDPNGYDTLRECKKEAPGFWMDVEDEACT